MSASEQKVLVSFSEYKRLKSIETKYRELTGNCKFQSSERCVLDAVSEISDLHWSSVPTFRNKHLFFPLFIPDSTTGINEPSTSSASSKLQQDGQGLDNDFISKITQAVVNELRRENVAISEHSQENTIPPPVYDNQVIQNDLNDSFDHKRLLLFVPKKFIETAKLLISSFDQRSNEFTWDSSGTVYIDQHSVPKSDIFKIFPCLFKKSHPKRLPGFQDVYLKLKSMGLLHLIRSSSSSPPVEKMTKQDGDVCGKTFSHARRA
ncbi:MAG: hypothetical protein FJ333_00825 [Sphingomonadales bacterium]|nr:hypothetical protein [Sphingomonadales bacterium]